MFFFLVNNEYDQVCGKRYVLMEKQMNYLLAQVACCEIGMRLLSVETLEEQKCLEKTYSTRIANNGCVWTSGTDLGCEGRYRWCGSNASMYTSSNLAWMSGEPNDYLEDEDCLVLWNFNGELKLNDELCLEPFSFICEDIDDPKKASPQDSRPPDFINKIRPR
ncbi:hypothetical protein B566_EDAN012132 [Ephemera danica]|nr:hypothetical protein B566_EDAN012132 [Ephemera danica]